MNKVTYLKVNNIKKKKGEEFFEGYARLNIVLVM